MLPLTTNWYMKLVFFIRVASVMLVSNIPQDIQTYIKLNSPLKITLCWNNMKDQTAIKKTPEIQKIQKSKASSGLCLCCWYECRVYITHDSVGNLECI